VTRLPGVRRFPSCGWVFGAALVVVGGLAMLALGLLFDPATAGETTRRAMTTAFAAAQIGLALIAIKTFQRLYQKSARLGTRRDR